MKLSIIFLKQNENFNFNYHPLSPHRCYGSHLKFYFYIIFNIFNLMCHIFQEFLIKMCFSLQNHFNNIHLNITKYFTNFIAYHCFLLFPRSHYDSFFIWLEHCLRSFLLRKIMWWHTSES